MFSEESLVEKLSKLQDTQDSINVLSHWLIHYRKNAKDAVRTWAAEFNKVSTQRKLAYLHLANDVLQVSRKKADDYSQAFSKILPGALRTFASHASSELVSKIRRLLTIWDERGVYGKDFVEELKKAVGGASSAKKEGDREKAPATASRSSNRPSSPTKQAPPQYSEQVKTILRQNDAIKNLHNTRVHLERTISTAEPSLDPVTVSSQVNSLTLALSNELTERKKLVAELKKWIDVEEGACVKIIDAIQDLSQSSMQPEFGNPTPTSPGSAPIQPQTLENESDKFSASIPDFSTTTPIMSPCSPPGALNPSAEAISASSQNLDTDTTTTDMDTSGTTSSAPPLGGLMIPPELLIAAQNAIQNNEPGSEEMLSILSGLGATGFNSKS